MGKPGGAKRFRGVANAPAAQGAPTFVIDADPKSLDAIRDTPFGWLLGPLTQGYLFPLDDRAIGPESRASRPDPRKTA